MPSPIVDPPVGSPDALIATETSDDYDSFCDDPEELEIVIRLEQENALIGDAARPETRPYNITDIEDYEAPRGIRLPEPSSTRFADDSVLLEILRDIRTQTGGESTMPPAKYALTLTSG